MVMSFSFLELGQTALSHNWSWFTCVALRSQTITKTRGGWSAYLRAFLRIQMLGADGLATGGVPLHIGGTHTMLYARVANLLSDGDGLRSALDWKGHASMKPCFRHCNIFKKDSDLAHRRPGFEEITCSDPSKFKAWTAKEVWSAVDVLQGAHARYASGDMRKGQVESLEKMYGLNYNGDGVLADVELRAVLDPVHAFTYDWVHTFLSDGLFSCEAFLMIKACQPLGIQQSHLCAYLKDSKWQFPLAHTSKSKSLYRVFDVYRASASAEADRLKSSASEMLGLYGLLRHFVEVHIGRRDDIAAQREVFDSACTMLDLIMSAKRGEVPVSVVATKLRSVTSTHLDLHIRCYGTDKIKPKHHWAADIPEQLERDQLVLDAFVVERMHLDVKSVAENVKNTSRFERSVLSGVLNKHFRTLTETAAFAGLRSQVVQLPGVPHLFVADAMELDGQKTSAGDLVFGGGEERVVGQVVACIADIDSMTLAIVVDVLQFVKPFSDHSSTWRLTATRAVWDASGIELPLAWYIGEDANVVVVHM
jgi:hypothetical protein